jgi:hypothetical protein
MGNSLFAFAVLTAGLLAAGTLCVADTDELKVQGPWAYVKRSDGPARPVKYMATTRAVEDGNIWFLLACSQDKKMSAAIMHTDGFPYHLRRPLLQVGLQLDESPSISVSAAPIEEKQITIDPRFARDLVLLLVESNRMVASIPEIDGSLHSYSFSLQPNDIALREIELRCALSQEPR